MLVAASRPLSGNTPLGRSTFRAAGNISIRTSNSAFTAVMYRQRVKVHAEGDKSDKMPSTEEVREIFKLGKEVFIRP